MFIKSLERFVWIDDEAGWTEQPTIAWPAVSGPHGKGALPDGWYYLTGEEKPVKSEAKSMTDTCGNTYKFRLHPQFDAMGRDWAAGAP